ncbi:hypothetical protein AB0O01_12050 [Streptomyces sp. NPDC093252]|uniref:WXG100-like domain-containing protein n=1 Tax=Streptomyces sp. NPDC093252 TaxID=3154980 RepID=UPI003446FAA2
MASDELNGLFLVLTGQQMPDADPELMRAHLVGPQRELEARIAEVQALLVRVAQSVAGESNGTFSEAYHEAMLTLAHPDGQAVLAGLRDAAGQLGDAMEESAYQVEYMNLMIVFQLGMFLVEFAATFVMALFNPVGALLRQAFLRNVYGKILTSLVFRVLLAIAEQQVLQVGLAVAMDRLAQWTLARQGRHTVQGSNYLVQAAAFGAVAAFVAVPVQFGASWLAQNLMKRTARNAGDRLSGELDNALSGRPGGPGGRGAGDGSEGGPAVKPVPRPRPGQDPGGFTGNTLTGIGGDDRAFARGLSGQVSWVVDGLSRGGDPGPAGRSFIEGTGEVFARRFGGDMGGDGPARELGEDWAGAFLLHLDRDGMGDALRSVLRDGRLPVAVVGDDVVRVMSERVAHWFGPRGRGGDVLGFALQGIGDGVTGVGSEVVYNGITQQKVTVSGGVFMTSMSSERFADALNLGADFLAAKYRLSDLNLNTALNLDTGPRTEGPARPSTTSTDNDTPRVAPDTADGPAPVRAVPGGADSGVITTSPPGTSTVTGNRYGTPIKGLGSVAGPLSGVSTFDVPGLPVINPTPMTNTSSPHAPLIGAPPPGPVPAPASGNGITDRSQPIVGAEGEVTGQYGRAPSPVTMLPPGSDATALPRAEVTGTPPFTTDRHGAGDPRTPDLGPGESLSPGTALVPGAGQNGPTVVAARPVPSTTTDSTVDRLFAVLAPGAGTTPDAGGRGRDPDRPTPGERSDFGRATGTTGSPGQLARDAGAPVTPLLPTDIDPDHSEDSAVTESTVLTDMGDTPPEAIATASSPGEIRLRAAVDAAADSARRQHDTGQRGSNSPGPSARTALTGTGTTDPRTPTPLRAINCVVLLGHLVHHLHPPTGPASTAETARTPGGGVRAAQPLRALDDTDTGRDSAADARELSLDDGPGPRLLTGTTNAERRLAPGPGWATVSSPAAVRDVLLNPATKPGSTALILIQHDNRPGHAFAAHRTETGVHWVEMQTESPEGPLISDDQPPHWPVLTRAVILGPDGRTIPDAFRDGTGDLTGRRPSDIEALLDPPRNRTYGAAGRGATASSPPRLPDSLMPSRAIRDKILRYISQDQLKNVLGVSRSSVVAWSSPTGPKITAKRVPWVAVFALIMRLHGLDTFDADGPERTWYDQAISHRAVREYIEELLPRANEHIVVLPPQSMRRTLASGVSAVTLDSLVQVARNTVSRWESGRQDPGISNQATYVAVLTLVMDFFGLDTYDTDGPELTWYNTTLRNPDVQAGRVERRDHVVTRLTELGFVPGNHGDGDPPPGAEPTGSGQDAEPVTLHHPWAPAEAAPEPPGPPGSVPPASPTGSLPPAPADRAPRATVVRAAHDSDEAVWSYQNLDAVYAGPTAQSALSLPETSDERAMLRNVTHDQLAALFDVTKSTLKSWRKPGGPAKGRTLYATALALAMEAHGADTYDYEADSTGRTWYDDITSRPAIRALMDVFRTRARQYVLILPPQHRRQGLTQDVPGRALDRLMGFDYDTVSYWHRGLWNPQEAHQAPYAAMMTLVMDFLGLHRYPHGADRAWYDLVTLNLAVRRFRADRRDDVFARLTELGFTRGRHYDSAAPDGGGHDMGPVHLHDIASATAMMTEPAIPPVLSGIDDITELSGLAPAPDITAFEGFTLAPGTTGLAGFTPAPDPTAHLDSAFSLDVGLTFSEPSPLADATSSLPTLPADITPLPEPGIAPHSSTSPAPDPTPLPDAFTEWDDSGWFEFAETEPLFLPDTPPSLHPAEDDGLDRTPETAGARSPLSDTDSAAMMRQLLTQEAQNLERRLVDVAPGGNCFFDALIEAGRDVPENIPPGMRINDIRNYFADDLDEDMNNHGNDSAWATFRHLIVDDPTDVHGQSMPHLDPYARFVHVIRTSGLWNSQAGDFAPRIAARAFNLRIHVLSLSPGSLAQAQPVVSTSYGTAGAREIWLAHVPGHWLALPRIPANAAPSTARDTALRGVSPAVPVPATKEQRTRLRGPIVRNLFAGLADTNHNSIKTWEAGRPVSEKKAVNYAAALAVVAEHHALTIPPDDAAFLQQALAHRDVRRRMKKIRTEVLAVLLPPPLPATHEQRVRMRGVLSRQDFADLGGFPLTSLALWETQGNPKGVRMVRYSAALAVAVQHRLGTDQSGVDATEQHLRDQDMEFLLQAIAHGQVSTRMGEVRDSIRKRLEELEEQGEQAEAPHPQEHDSSTETPAPSPGPAVAEPPPARKRPRGESASVLRRSKRVRTAAQSTAHVTPTPPSSRTSSPLFTPRSSPLSSPPPDSPPPPPAKKRRARTTRRQPASTSPPVPPSYAQRIRLRGRISATALQRVLGVSNKTIPSWETDTSPRGKNAVAYAAALAVLAEYQLPADQHEDDAEFLRLALAHPEVSTHMETIRTEIVSLLQRLPLPVTYAQRIHLRQGLARSALERILKISDGSIHRWETKGDPSAEATVNYTAALAVIIEYAAETEHVRLDDEDADFLGRAYAHTDVSHAMGTLRTAIRQALDILWEQPGSLGSGTPDSSASGGRDLAADAFRTLTQDA